MHTSKIRGIYPRYTREYSGPLPTVMWYLLSLLLSLQPSHVASLAYTRIDDLRPPSYPPHLRCAHYALSSFRLKAHVSHALSVGGTCLQDCFCAPLVRLDSTKTHTSCSEAGSKMCGGREFV